MTALEWPAGILPFARVKWWPEGMVRSGGGALSGDEQVAVTDGGGRWRASLPLGAVYGPDRIRTYRSLLAQMQFGAVPIVVPVVDRPQLPTNPSGSGTATDLPYSDGTRHSDDAGFANNGLVAVLDGATVLRATTLTANVSVIGPLRGGEYFTVVHPTMGARLYLVMRVAGDGATRELAIWPPAREAMANGTELDFSDPRCLMRLANPGAASALELAPPWIGRPVLEFVEQAPDWPD